MKNSDKMWIWCFLSSIILLINGEEVLSIVILILSLVYFLLSIWTKDKEKI